MILPDPGSLTRAGVVGAGTMGAGIAQLFLGAGCEVCVFEPQESSRAAAIRKIATGLERWETKGVIPSANEAGGRLTLCSALEELQDCEWVVEAISEERAAKEKVFRALGIHCGPEAVLASNTSSISITHLGTVSGRPERVVGMHFFNPPPVMRLVEVVAGLRTAPEVVAATRTLAERLGKVPVVAQDRPGFLSNRILMPMLNEAFFALEEGVGTADEIDQVMKLGMAHPMGPFELADLIGLDVCLQILEVLHADLGDPKYRPSTLLRKHVEAGWLGRKTGRGVFPYES